MTHDHPFGCTVEFRNDIIQPFLPADTGFKTRAEQHRAGFAGDIHCGLETITKMAGNGFDLVHDG
jgi:hypothetical protein